MFHIRHRWAIVSVKAMEYQQYFMRGPKAGQEFGAPSPVTDVLERCSGCGRYRNREIDGRWTLEELTREVS